MSPINQRGLFDTNIVIFGTRLNRDQLPREAALSTVTLAELSVGPLMVQGTDEAAQSERSRRMTVLARAESEFSSLPFDTEAARIFGSLSAAMVAKDLKPRNHTADLMIAATAAAHRLPLYTTNPKDFEPLSEFVTVVGVDVPD
ncbi:MAG: type II toxin-antitoxin system VapC family toxin [Candidatus Nanopelagicales bacterium]